MIGGGFVLELRMDLGFGVKGQGVGIWLRWRLFLNPIMCVNYIIGG